MIKKLLLTGAISSLVALAAPITATNTRPVGVNGPPPGENSLQSYLDHVYGCTDCVDAKTAQQTAALWMEPGLPPQQIAPIIVAHDAANGDPFGIFSGTDTTTATLVDIFLSGAPGGSSAPSASLRFNANGTITISDTTGGSTCAADFVNCGTFSGINQGSFGFFINSNGTNLFTSDSANPALGGSQAHALAYVGAGDKWTLAFEDGTDFDYNDRIVSIESIVPVPEPASVVLFGSLLILFATGLRRRLATKA